MHKVVDVIHFSFQEMKGEMTGDRRPKYRDSIRPRRPWKVQMAVLGNNNGREIFSEVEFTVLVRNELISQVGMLGDISCGFFKQTWSSGHLQSKTGLFVIVLYKIFILLFLYESIFSKVYRVVSKMNELFKIQLHDFVTFLLIVKTNFILFWDYPRILNFLITLEN